MARPAAYSGTERNDRRQCRVVSPPGGRERPVLARRRESDSRGQASTGGCDAGLQQSHGTETSRSGRRSTFDCSGNHLQRGFLNNRTWTAARIETFRYRETVVVLRHSHRLTLARESHFHVVAPVPDAPVLQEEKRRGIGADHSVRSQSRPSFEPFGASIGESRGDRAPVTKRYGDHLLMLSGLDE